MTIDTSLISPLSLQECLSRLEEVRKKETGSSERKSNSLRWSVSGRTFTVRKNGPHFGLHVHGELSERPQGTVITCSAEIDWAANKLSSVWLAGAVPLLTCLALGLLLNGFLNGFSKELILLFLFFISGPVFFILQRQLDIRQSERDRKEMLEFIRRILDAKPGSP